MHAQFLVQTCGVNSLCAYFLFHVALWIDGVIHSYLPIWGDWVLQHVHTRMDTHMRTHTLSKGNVSPGVAPQNINQDICFDSLSAQRVVCGSRVHWYANRVPKSCLCTRRNFCRRRTGLCLSHSASLGFPDILMTKLPLCYFRKGSSFHFIYKNDHKKETQTSHPKLTPRAFFLHLSTDEVTYSLFRGVLSTTVFWKRGKGECSMCWRDRCLPLASLVLWKLPKQPFSITIMWKPERGERVSIKILPVPDCV